MVSKSQRNRKKRPIGGEVVHTLHKHSMMSAFAIIEIEQLKLAAQKLREQCDWYGRREDINIYNALIDVIRITDEKFDTVSISVN
jgi:hypothetical protein